MGDSLKTPARFRGGTKVEKKPPGAASLKRCVYLKLTVHVPLARSGRRL